MTRGTLNTLNFKKKKNSLLMAQRVYTLRRPLRQSGEGMQFSHIKTCRNLTRPICLKLIVSLTGSLRGQLIKCFTTL